MGTVELRSADDEILAVPLEAAKLSKTIGTMLGVMDDDDKEPIPLIKVDAKILRIVFEWINHKLKDKEEEFTKFEESLFSVDIFTVYAIIQAANYMDIEDLLKRSCTEVAMRLEGKTSAEMRVVLGMPNDWKPEEETE